MKMFYLCGEITPKLQFVVFQKQILWHSQVTTEGDFTDQLTP